MNLAKPDWNSKAHILALILIGNNLENCFCQCKMHYAKLMRGGCLCG